jgi:hypothetical protein
MGKTKVEYCEQGKKGKDKKRRKWRGGRGVKLRNRGGGKEK